MRTNSKNGLNKPNDVIVFDIPEASVTDRGRAKKLRYLKRAKGVTHVGAVPSRVDGDRLIIRRDELMRCLFGPNWEDFR